MNLNVLILMFMVTPKTRQAITFSSEYSVEEACAEARERKAELWGLWAVFRGDASWSEIPDDTDKMASVAHVVRKRLSCQEGK